MMENMKMRMNIMSPREPIDGRAVTSVLKMSCNFCYFLTKRKILSILSVRRIVLSISKFETIPSQVIARIMIVPATTIKSN